MTKEESKLQQHAAGWVIYQASGKMLVDTIRDRRIECQQAFAGQWDAEYNWTRLYKMGFRCGRVGVVNSRFLRAYDLPLWRIVLGRASR